MDCHRVLRMYTHVTRKNKIHGTHFTRLFYMLSLVTSLLFFKLVKWIKYIHPCIKIYFQEFYVWRIGNFPKSSNKKTSLLYIHTHFYLQREFYQHCRYKRLPLYFFILHIILFWCLNFRIKRFSKEKLKNFNFEWILVNIVHQNTYGRLCQK